MLEWDENKTRWERWSLLFSTKEKPSPSHGVWSRVNMIDNTSHGKLISKSHLSPISLYVTLRMTATVASCTYSVKISQLENITHAVSAVKQKPFATVLSCH